MNLELLKQQVLREEVQGRWIYWRHKGNKTWGKNFVYNVVGGIIELTDSSSYSKYPTRVLADEIDYIITEP